MSNSGKASMDAIIASGAKLKSAIDYLDEEGHTQTTIRDTNETRMTEPHYGKKHRYASIQ